MAITDEVLNELLKDYQKRLFQNPGSFGYLTHLFEQAWVR